MNNYKRQNFDEFTLFTIYLYLAIYVSRGIQCFKTFRHSTKFKTIPYPFWSKILKKTENHNYPVEKKQKKKITIEENILENLNLNNNAFIG